MNSNSIEVLSYYSFVIFECETIEPGACCF